MNIDTFVDVLYRSGNVHLFGPDGGAFTESDVKVEYLIESDWTSSYAVSGADPRGFKLLHDDILDAYVLRVFPEFEVSGNKRSVRITVGHFEPDVMDVEIITPNRPIGPISGQESMPIRSPMWFHD